MFEVLQGPEQHVLSGTTTQWFLKSSDVLVAWRLHCNLLSAVERVELRKPLAARQTRFTAAMVAGMHAAVFCYYTSKYVATLGIYYV